ncbi:recombinase family protein [Microtetraspora fusca]|uniref:Recombinase family protein n=1 Tax=Microtetraspora fusca TaxID=1997 RepID=A0ABW6VKH3_MICFU|nr:recombinase family protein [Microtetraspora fusca]
MAEFEADLGHLRTREGMARAKRQAKPALPAFFPAAICISNLIKFLIQFARA